MSLGWLRGPIATVFTAFDSNLNFDPTGQRRLLDFLLQSGSISAHFVRSGMGQMYTFSFDEVKAMADTAVAHVGDQAPVLVGTSGIWDRHFDARPDAAQYQREAEELTAYAEGVGATGTVHVIPEAIAPSEGETESDVTLRYFERVSAYATKPVLIYQPPMTIAEYCVSPGLVAKLAALPNLAGIKISSPDAGYLFDCTWAVRDSEFEIVCGDERAYFAGLCYGARAVIGQGTSVNPTIVAAALARFEAGDLVGAMEAQASINLLCSESAPAVEFLKRYATEKGFPVPPFSRETKSNPYLSVAEPLREAEYGVFKALLEREVARF